MDGGAWVAVAGLLFGAFSLWFTSRLSERRDRQQRRVRAIDDAAIAVAGVLALLTDANPIRWTFAAGLNAADIAEGWVSQWEDVRIGLLRLSVTLPTAVERELARSLEVALNKSLVTSSGYGVALPQIKEPLTFERALEDYQEAVAIADRLLAALNPSA